MKKKLTQAALAASLGLNRSTICGYVQKGMPLTTRAVALEWIRMNVSSIGGGWHFPRQAKHFRGG